VTSWKQLDQAIAFAAVAHGGQVRKYDGLPYIVHPLRVMTILHETASIVTEDQLVAAVLHDVVEDTPVSIETIERRFGSAVAAMVFDLTDQFVLPSQGNRAARKQLERERLATISAQAQDIKLADLIDNTSSIAANDPGFARTYLREKELVLEVMNKGDRRLYDRALASLAWGQGQLVQHRLEKADDTRPSTAAPPAAPGLDRQPDGLGPVPGLAGVASIAR
jgi:hypothetical protein